MQVFADHHGHAIHLFERDCSAQRRHQKVLEEAPAPGLSVQRRRQMGSAAVAAARAVNYVGAGTVEFIVDESGEFYFMEMNTRLQVEHPVTEMITALDLVEWQFRVAAGEPLPLTQEQIPMRGHAVEARVYAEDAERGFLPAAGTIAFLREPAARPGLRIDTGVRAGDEVGVHYDPMIAKVVAWGEDRPSALRRLHTALADYQIVGLTTNLRFLRGLITRPDFAEAHVHPERLDTGIIERNRDALHQHAAHFDVRMIALATLWELLDFESRARKRAPVSDEPSSPWHRCDGWRLNQDNHHELVFHANGQRYPVTAHYREAMFQLEVAGISMAVTGELDRDGELHADLGGVRCRARVVQHGDALAVFAFGDSCVLLQERHARAQDEIEAGGLVAPLPGNIIQVLVRAGEQVSKGQPLVVMEAMKMEHTIAAPAAGTVKEIYFAAGEQVKEGAALLSLEAESTE
jgi:3-methylcrotonyl-CoA carboxylase alpha subunit